MEKLAASFRTIRSALFSPKNSLEKRITYAMVICATMGELIGFTESFILGLPIQAVLLPLISFIFLILLSLWGFRTRNTNLFAMISIGICALILFPLMFFANDGLSGGMAFYFSLTIVCITLALHGKTKIIYFVISIVENTALFILYNRRPDLFTPLSASDAFMDQLSSMLVTCVVLFIFSLTVSKQNSNDRDKIKQLSVLYERQANTDDLTGLYNRRYFNNFLKLAILTLGDTGKLHVAMFDIDDFKYVNDKYGHPFGDTVLKNFALILADCVSTSGVTACRYGGEEFLLLIPKKNKDEALELTEEVLRKTREKIKLDENKFVTVSAGFITCTEDMTYDVLLQEVDKKLYLAKKSGKNKVIS